MEDKTETCAVSLAELVCIRDAVSRLGVMAFDVVGKIDRIVSGGQPSGLRQRVMQPCRSWASETQAAHNRARAHGNPMDRHRELITGKLRQVYVVRGFGYRWHYASRAVQASQASGVRQQAFRAMIEDGTVRVRGNRCWLSELDSLVLDADGQFLHGSAVAQAGFPITA